MHARPPAHGGQAVRSPETSAIQDGFGAVFNRYHRCRLQPITDHKKSSRLGEIYGRGRGVGRGLAIGPDLGDGVGPGVAVGDAVAVGVAVAVGEAHSPDRESLPLLFRYPDYGRGGGVGRGRGTVVRFTAARRSSRPQPKTLFGGPASPHWVEEIKCAVWFKASRLAVI